MKPLKTLLSLLLLTLPAHAIIIEDSAERLVFDLTWTTPNRTGIQLFGAGTGSGGSSVHILEGSLNPYGWIVEAHRAGYPWYTFEVLFLGWNPDGISDPPDPMWGTASQPRIGRSVPADHLLPIPGNDHAVRVVYGALPAPVPDAGGTLLLLAMALSGLVAVRGRWKP